MKTTKNIRQRITWKDIQQLERNVQKFYKAHSNLDKFPFLLLEAICAIYSEYMETQQNKNINLNIASNRPVILRSEVIKRYRKREPDDNLNSMYATDKGQINIRLEQLSHDKDELTGELLNPKRLIIVKTTRNQSEKNNYFVIDSSKKKKITKRKAPAEQLTPMAQLSPEQIFRNNCDRWKLNNFIGDKSLKAADLPKIESALNPIDFDDESKAYFYVSCLFRRHNYHTWGKDLLKSRTVIWHLFNLLLQSFHRPFWRACFVLQFVDKSLLEKVTKDFPDHILTNERINLALDTIKTKNVERYLMEYKDREMYAEELLKEFSAFKFSFE